MVRLMKKSERFPKEWESFQRCGAGGFISIAEKFDEQLAEKGWYSQHLTKSLPVIDPDKSDFKSNRYNMPKSNYFHVDKQVEKRIEKVVEKSKRHKPVPLSQILDDIKPKEWIISQFGCKGAGLLLAGDKGSGKTAFCYRAAEAIAKGSIFMGQLETVQKKVLIWQADESRSNALSKIKMMGLEYDTPIDWAFSDDKGWADLDIDYLKETIQANNYGAVFIDSITGLMLGKKVRIYDPEFSTPLFKLNRLAGELGVLIVICSHLSKEERIEVNLNDVLGSGTITTAISDIWGLWADQEDRELYHLSCLGKRNCDITNFWNLRGNKEDYSFELESVGSDDILPDRKATLKYKFLNYLQVNNTKLTVDELADNFRCNQEVARRILVILFEEQQIKREKFSSGTGRPFYKYSANTFPTSDRDGSV